MPESIHIGQYNFVAVSYIVSKLIIFSVCLYIMVSDKMARCVTSRTSVGLLMLSSLACGIYAVNHNGAINHNAEVLFSFAVATLALRCLWIKIVQRYYTQFKRKSKYDNIRNHSGA